MRRTVTLSALAISVALRLVASGPPAAAASQRKAWALVRDDDPARVRSASNGGFGGVCVLGQTNRVNGSGYPKAVEFSGGARCTSEGKPVAVYQEGRSTLYKGVRDSYLAEGNDIFGPQDWSISKGSYGGGTRDLQYTNNLTLRLTTPDGQPWGVKPSDCDFDGPNSVRCDLDKPGRVT